MTGPSISARKTIVLAISDSKVGGGQAVVLRLAQHLKESDRILVLCPRGNLYDRVAESGIEVCEVNFGPGSLYSVRRKLTGLGEVTVNAHLLGTTFWIALSLLFCRVKLVCTLLNPLIYENISPLRRVLFPLIVKLLALKVDRFIGVSPDICTSITRCARSVQVYYAPPSINLEDFPFDAGGGDGEGYRVGIVGRLSYAKGHDYFIAAAELLSRSRSDLTFFVVGDGELSDELQAKVKKVGMGSRIIFTGYLPDINPMLRSLDLVVMPSLFEGIPCTLLELMAMGIPVIASAVGGIPSVIVDGENGILVPPRDPEAISRATVRLLEDRALRERLAVRARKNIETDFDSENVYHNYRKLLDWREVK